MVKIIFSTHWLPVGLPTGSQWVANSGLSGSLNFKKLAVKNIAIDLISSLIFATREKGEVLNYQ